MYCKVIKIRPTSKWAVCFYDNEFQRTGREAEIFDRERDALNRVAELIALEGYNFIR